MAKKRKKTRKKTRSQNILKARFQKDAIPLLNEAQRMLRRRKNDRALKLATDALSLARDQQQKQAAKQIISEIHFRIAMLGEIDEQLPHLKQALSLTPDDARIRFYHAIALWRQNRLSEALEDLNIVAKQEPNRPGLAYLLQLARLSQGKSWSTKNLSPAEVNTLQTVQKLLSGKRILPSVMPPATIQAEIWGPLLEMDTGHSAPVEPLKEAASKTHIKGLKGLLYYYEGVAAMRSGDGERARAAWSKAQTMGLSNPWLNDNFAYRLRERATELAKEKQWSDIVNLTSRRPDEIQDRILCETIALAYFHLGYNEAQAENWQRAVYHWRHAEEWASNRHIAQNLALAEEALENWQRAADAWRDMIRRRPRSTKNPDYLTDNQISGIWQHLAECYRHVGDLPEIIACLKNAIKYAETDVEVRMELAQVYYVNDYEDAAQKQFEQILEIDPNQLDALVRLAHIYLEQRAHDSIALWKRVLEIQPKHVDARNGLAYAYLKWLDSRPLHETDDIVEQILNDLPDHPHILVGIALRYQQLEDDEESRDFFLRAYECGPEDVKTVDMVIYNLLLLGGEAEVEAMIPQVRQIEGLLPGFWLDLARRVLPKNQDPEWIKRFLEEAVALAGQPYVEDSKATLLMRAYEVIERVAPPVLCRYFAQRIEKEVPNSGAVEFVEAFNALAEDDERNAKRWFNKAKRLARRAKDKSALDFIEQMEHVNLFMRDFDISPGLIARLMELFPDGPPDFDNIFD